MKRTPLKPGGFLVRYTALRPGRPLERRTPLPPVSAKRRAENRERQVMVNELWPDGLRPRCIVPGCNKLADDLHEPLTRGRGGSITDPNCGVPVCRGHHDEIQKGPDWAYELVLMVHSWDRRSLAELAEARRRALADAELALIEQRGLESEWSREAS